MDHQNDRQARQRYEQSLVRDAILQIVIGLLVCATLSVFIAAYFFILR